MKGQHEFPEVTDIKLTNLLSKKIKSLTKHLPEINCSTPIRIKSPEDDLAEPVSSSSGKYSVVHLNKLFLGQLAIRAILHESIMPFLMMESV